MWDDLSNINRATSFGFDNYRPPQVIVVYRSFSNFDVDLQLRERDLKVQKLIEEFKKLTRVFKRKLFPRLFAIESPEPVPSPQVHRAPVLLVRARGQAPRKMR